MFLFNTAISSFRLVELPLYGWQFTWTNKQSSPLLERLDWFFTSHTWTLSYPVMFVKSLVIETSDHVPCLVSFGTNIPGKTLFCFQNYWLEHDDFLNVVSEGCKTDCPVQDIAKRITAKFKNLRGSIKQWQKHLSSLKQVIDNVKTVLGFLEFIEDYRDLSLGEWNFKDILSQHLITLLKQEKIYWKQCGLVKWVKSGDCNTKFFNANATIKHRRSLVSTI